MVNDNHTFSRLCIAEKSKGFGKAGPDCTSSAEDSGLEVLFSLGDALSSRSNDHRSN